jgi:cysteine desulfurase
MFFKHLLSFMTHRRVYLDYASSTPLDSAMLKKVPRIPLWYQGVNPSALHKEGVALKKVREDARRLVAETLSAHTDEIIFTSSATESDNLAIVGCIKHFLSIGILPEAIAVYHSPFEHAAVTEPLQHLDTRIRICELVHEGGYVLPDTITIPEDVSAVLISVLYVQNEIGTTQPIKEIAKRIRKLRKQYPEKTILFHVDATQAPLYYDLTIPKLGIDMMTLGATKLYCPKGIGVLYKRRGITLAPLYYGGGQEFGLRPGTEPVSLIHTFAHALSYAQRVQEEAHQTICTYQTYCEKRVKELLPHIRITGDGERSPHISHFALRGIDSELLVLELDARGIAVSSKSACKNEDESESAIVSLLYPEKEYGAIRVSYGRKTTTRDIDRFVRALYAVAVKYHLTTSRE